MPPSPRPPRQDFATPKSPALDEQQFSQLVRDVAGSRSAVSVLKNLLRDSGYDELDGESGTGLAVLLESMHQRLDLAVGTLEEVHARLGLSCWPLRSVPPA